MKSLLRPPSPGCERGDMTDLHVTRIDPADESQVEALLELDTLVWADAGRRPREAQLRDTPQRAGFIATRGGEPAGTAGSWDVEVSVPAAGDAAASLRPAEGLTWIGVHPDHRRRGVLTAVMGHHLRWTRDEQGRSLSVLKASEHAIYGRFGYGVASTVPLELRAGYELRRAGAGAGARRRDDPAHHDGQPGPGGPVARHRPSGRRHRRRAGRAQPRGLRPPAPRQPREPRRP